MNERTSDKVDKWRKALKLARYMLATLAFIMVVLIVIVQFLTLTNVQTTTDRLLSCTDPTGECYKSGDRRSGAAIKTINESQKRVVTIAAYCAKQPGNTTLAQIEDCVNQELAR